MVADWNFFTKTSQDFGPGGRTLTLAKGQTPSHAVRAWNAENPGRKIDLKGLLSANPGVDPRKYVAGKAYNMPSSVFDRNNPGNVRFYNQKWDGELPAGLNKGDFSVFDTKENGGRAAIKTLFNIAKRISVPTLEKIMSIYSPSSENDTAKHVSNISRISGIPSDRELKLDDVGQWVDVARGLFRSETGNKYTFTPAGMTNIVISAIGKKK